MKSVQNSIVFGIRCFGIVHTTKHDFLDFPRPGIRFFGRLDRAFLGKISAPRQLGQSRAGPAREIRKIRVLASLAVLRPSGYSWFGFQNLPEFSVPFSRLMKKYENLLIFLISHRFALASQPARGGKGPLFVRFWAKIAKK